MGELGEVKSPKLFQFSDMRRVLGAVRTDKVVNSFKDILKFILR
ncbi:hypothetical protein HMPREF0290_0408 [Corynebacterium efficiens YS-314]|nr:hypothetical protein HMPREF0290_0408 [Corynebacterium efficiens YS-314]